MSKYYSVAVKKERTIIYRLELVVKSMLEEEQIDEEWKQTEHSDGGNSGLRKAIEEFAETCNEDHWSEDYEDDNIDVDGFHEGINELETSPDDYEIVEYKNSMPDLKSQLEDELEVKNKEIAELKKKLEEK